MPLHGTPAFITIRRAEPDDYDALARIMEGPRAIAGTQQLPFPSRELWRTRIAEVDLSVYSLVAVLGAGEDKEGEIVGNLSLNLNLTRIARRHVASIALAVRDDYQGRGVGSRLMSEAITLADKWLNIVRLELELIAGNDAAQRMYRRYGFDVEGTMKMWVYREGQFKDAIAMARIRPDLVPKKPGRRPRR